MSKAKLEHAFPKLKDSDYKITSAEDLSYNCIAWAAGDTSRCWWPDKVNCGYYWPAGVRREASLEAFVEAFETLGYSICNSVEYEIGFEKIALYAKLGGEPTHAARQVYLNRWTTKAGQLEDMEHKLEDIQGSVYGMVVLYMKRPIQG